MAIVQISKIQQRRGLQQDLPQLAAGEIGWSIDSRRAYIGNGTIEEGAPSEGRTELLTEFSIISFTAGFAGNIKVVEGNVAVLQGNITTINNEIAVLQAGSTTSNSVSLLSSTSGLITGIPSTNATISYTATQGAKQRTGTIVMTRNGSTVNYSDDYIESGTTDLVLSMNANSSYSNLNYSTTTATNLLYRITTQQ
jgi:hypothetical protein